MIQWTEKRRGKFESWHAAGTCPVSANTFACRNTEEQRTNIKRHRWGTEMCPRHEDFQGGVRQTCNGAAEQWQWEGEGAIRARHTDVHNDNLSSTVLLKITQSGSRAGRPWTPGNYVSTANKRRRRVTSRFRVLARARDMSRVEF